MTGKRSARADLKTSQIEIKHTPDIEYELSELYRRYSEQRNSKMHLKSLSVASKDLQKGQSAFCLPAPERFVRKIRPVSMKGRLSTGGEINPNQSPCPSPCQATENMPSSILLNDPYDDLLHKLMNGCEIDHDPCPSDASTIGTHCMQTS
jgi:hypothetical protein